jgi:8-oxo-dGTP pyrophosphatase MutT (NUDIX family)
MAVPASSTGARRILKAAARRLQKLRKLLWRFRGKPVGVHAIAFTKGGKVVLVQLTYASGWRVPGGGVKKGEKLLDAAARELKEEIGMVGYGAARPVDRPEGMEGDWGPLFIFDDVEYRPRRSLEIDAVREFDLAALPHDLARQSRLWLDHVGKRV